MKDAQPCEFGDCIGCMNGWGKVLIFDCERLDRLRKFDLGMEQYGAVGR